MVDHIGINLSPDISTVLMGFRGFPEPFFHVQKAATLINSAIWMLWHIPLCFIKGTYQYSGSYLWFSISLLGSAFSLAALHKVKGSIMPCILLHAIGNAVVSYGLSIRNGIGAIVSYICQIAFAILITCLFNKANKADLQNGNSI